MTERMAFERWCFKNGYGFNSFKLADSSIRYFDSTTEKMWEAFQYALTLGRVLEQINPK